MRRKSKRQPTPIEPFEPRYLLGTIYVDASATGATHNGTSWNSAYVDLQQGLAAAVSGDEIHVADGTYKPTSGNDRSQAFNLKSGIRILGGYSGMGSASPDSRNAVSAPTILSGDIGSAGDISDNSIHVMLVAANSNNILVDGVTITKGNANGNYADNTDSGGGMLNLGASVTLKNCTLTSNFAGSPFQGGGGAAVANLGAVVGANFFLGCAFVDNMTPDGGGGAMSNLNCSASIDRCQFIRNSANGGGAIANAAAGAYITNSVFAGNIVKIAGGAIYNEQSNVTVANSVFAGNSAWDPDDAAGGAIFSESASADILNCTFVANSAIFGGAIYASFGVIRNSIFWDNSAANGSQVYKDRDRPVDVAYSDVQGGHSGAGNISENPQFVRDPSPGPDAIWGTADDDIGNVRLQINSPCIDAGNNADASSNAMTDPDGNPRIIDVTGVKEPGAIIDLGAFERAMPFADGKFLVDGDRPIVAVTFSADILQSSVTASDLILKNQNTGATLDSATVISVNVDATSQTLAWKLIPTLPDGNYHATLPAGSVLDTNSQQALSVGLEFDFFILGADANRDRKVDISDFTALVLNWQGSGKVFSQGDFNYDGQVDGADLAILSSRWQQTLPPPVATPTAVAVRTAAVRTPVRMISVVS